MVVNALSVVHGSKNLCMEKGSPSALSLLRKELPFMKRSDLEQYLGQKVTVSFPFDTYTGYLHKTEEAAFRNDSNIYLKPSV